MIRRLCPWAIVHVRARAHTPRQCVIVINIRLSILSRVPRTNTVCIEARIRVG
jgi:hypothetical protein